MANHPNQGGKSNRQGPSPTRQSKASRGPIQGNNPSKTSGPARPWSPGTGAKSSGAGRNASGHSWKQSPPASHGSGHSDGRFYLGGKKSPKSHNPHPK